MKTLVAGLNMPASPPNPHAQQQRAASNCMMSMITFGSACSPAGVLSNGDVTTSDCSAACPPGLAAVSRRPCRHCGVHAVQHPSGDDVDRLLCRAERRAHRPGLQRHLRVCGNCNFRLLIILLFIYFSDHFSHISQRHVTPICT